MEKVDWNVDLKTCNFLTNIYHKTHSLTRLWGKGTVECRTAIRYITQLWSSVIEFNIACGLGGQRNRGLTWRGLTWLLLYLLENWLDMIIMESTQCYSANVSGESRRTPSHSLITVVTHLGLVWTSLESECVWDVVEMPSRLLKQWPWLSLFSALFEWKSLDLLCWLGHLESIQVDGDNEKLKGIYFLSSVACSWGNNPRNVILFIDSLWSTEEKCII